VFASWLEKPGRKGGEGVADVLVGLLGGFPLDVNSMHEIVTDSLGNDVTLCGLNGPSVRYRLSGSVCYVDIVSQHDIRSAATHAESRTATTRNRRLIISASAKSNATPWFAMANERSTRHKRKFGIGFVLGYGIRELISRRRRSQYLRDTHGLK
jgi:hypothetical protein